MKTREAKINLGLERDSRLNLKLQLGSVLNSDE